VTLIVGILPKKVLIDSALTFERKRHPVKHISFMIEKIIEL